MKDIVKSILKETVSDQANLIASYSPYAFRRGVAMISNDYSGSTGADQPADSNVDFSESGAIHELASLHRALADHMESTGRKGSAIWHRRIASRLTEV